MNQLILYKEEMVSDKKFTISKGERLEHLLSILKLQEGDLLRVALLDVGRAQGRLVLLTEDKAEIELEGPFEETVPTLPPLHVLVGLSRPPTLKKILEYATSMGVKSYHVLPTHLSDKGYLTSKIFRPEVYEPLMDLGLSQSNFYYQRPSFEFIKTSSPWPYCQEKENKGVQKFVLDPYTKKSWFDYQLDPKRPIVLAIGPERGFTKIEDQKFLESGFSPVHISDTLLRVELALFYALAQIELVLY